VAGSTSVEPFAELLAEEYMNRFPGKMVYVQGGGSTAGIQATMTGTTDIGMSSRPLKGPERKLHAIEIARDAIALIVHPENHIDNLSTKMVQEIFSGRIKSWKEVGGPNHQITVVTREEGSGTRSFRTQMGQLDNWSRAILTASVTSLWDWSTMESRL
jgi:phosphate transport system substrate-binding protein